MSISLTLTNLTTNTSRSITSIIDGDTYSWRIDDSLDSGVLMYTDNNLTPVEPFTLATITFGDGGVSESMWVAEDSVVLVSKMSATKTYQHTLKLIELTKILEKIVVTGLCMTPTEYKLNTQLYANLKAQFSAAINKINVQLNNIELNAASNYDINNFMINAPSETFIFNNATAREILDEICSAIDSRIYVSEAAIVAGKLRLNLKYQRMIPTTSVVLGEDTHHTLISESASNSVESYAGEVVSHVESAQSQNEIRFQDTFKANDAIATSNNRVMSLPYAIQYPTAFRIKSTAAKISVKGTYYVAGDSSAHYITRDITSASGADTRAWFDALDYFVDYEYWQTLSLSDQQKTLYYQRGQAEVDVSRTYKSLIVTKSVFTTMFTELLNNWYTANASAIQDYMAYEAQHATPAGTLTSINKESVTTGDIDDIIFDIAYIGEIEGLATSVKQADRTFFERDLMVVDGQRASVIDIERYGQNLKGKIDRLGNNLFYIDCNVDNYDYILPLMTKLTDYDNGIIYQVDISRHTDRETWYEVRYYIAKDFNNLNERIALRKEKRIYAIPTKGYQVILPDRETVVIDNYNPSHNSISLGATSTDQRATTCWTIMQVAMGGTGIVSNAFVKSDINDGAGAAVYENFVLPVTGYGSGNTINLVCKFYDNASAGLSIDTSSYGGINWLGGKKVCYNKYTNDYGYAKNPKVEWGYFPNERTTQGVKAQPKLLLSGTGAETTGTYFKSEYTGFRKDPSEALCFQKIIRVETGKPSVIIGRFVDYNSIFQDFSNKNIYLYYQTTDRSPYQLGDKKVRYDTLNGDTRISLLGAMGVEGQYYISLVKNNLNNVDKYNMAIGDEDGNMFIASNGLCSSSTLFTFYKKESIG